MRQARFDSIVERGPRMSEAARADVEALRTSDRLQRIFDTDFRSGRAAAAQPEAAPTRQGRAAAGGGGLLSSRRARVIIGLVPAYLAAAVLAIETVSLLRDGSEPIALFSAVTADGEADDPAAGQAAAGGEVTARQGSVPSGETTVAAGREVPAGAGKAGGNAAPAPSPAEGERLALAPVPTEHALRREALAAPETPAAEAPAGEVLGKAAYDLGKAVESGPAAEHEGDPEPSVSARAPLEDDGGTVPQPTWSLRAEPPVPLPAPRLARLSDVLETDSGRSGLDGARAQPRAAQPPIRAHAPRRQSASAPPRIVVHYHGEAGASAARRVAAELQARGLGRTELRPVAFAVSRANVRYFHDQNRPVARAVNELLRSMWRRSDLRDFTHYAPLPSVRTVEVWLPG